MGEAREAAVDEAVAEVEVAVEVAVCKVAASSLRWFEGLRARQREVPNTETNVKWRELSFVLDFLRISYF